MNQIILPLVIRALTPIHVGSGETSGDVDQPVIKDSLGIPFIPASSLKGAIKANLSDSSLKSVLGSDPGEQPSKPSKVKIYDAYPILFPARSLFGLYVYVTSPYLIRWYMDLQENINRNCWEKLDLNIFINNLDKDKALCIEANRFSLEKLGGKWRNRGLFNEEEFLLENINDNGKFKKFLENFLRLSEDEAKHVAVISDDRITSVINKSLIRYTRVALEDNIKKVREGALWTEEYVPRNTIYLSYISYEENLEKTNKEDYQRISDLITSIKDSLMFIGGLETLGRGLVRLSIVDCDNSGEGGGGRI